MKKALILCLWSLCILMSCQSNDPIQVKGTVQWDRSNIEDFPPLISIFDVETQLKVQDLEVDSIGNFEATLAKGDYVLKPQLYYHWQGEDIASIDVEKSTQKVTIPDAANLVYKLYTKEKPQFAMKKGILHDFSPTHQDSLTTFMKAYMDFYQVPGASLALLKDGKIIYHNVYGVTNMDTQEKVNSETLFEAGSITKTVLSFIVLRLAEKGIIDLDKPLHEYLSFEDISHDDRYKKITAKTVLTHRTGFPNWARGKFELKFDPGTNYGYSGEAFEYLKRVIEKVTNKSISELLQEEFITPLHLKNIYFSGSEFSSELFANGHKKGKVSEKRNIKSPMMAYSMVTKADAFAEFAIAIRNRKGLSKKTYDELFTIASTRNDGTHWGLGFRIEDTKFGRTHGHSGSTNPGYIGNYVYFDDLDMGYVVLTNSQMGGWLSIPLLTEFLITGK